MKQERIQKQRRRQRPGGDEEVPMPPTVDTPAADRARHTVKKIDEAIGHKSP